MLYELFSEPGNVTPNFVLPLVDFKLNYGPYCKNRCKVFINPPLWYAPGGLIITHLLLWYAPPGRTGGGVNENISPASNSWCKVKLIFIGHSGSNYSAFYLYMATSVGLSATLSYAHA